MKTNKATATNRHQRRANKRAKRASPKKARSRLIEVDLSMRFPNLNPDKQDAIVRVFTETMLALGVIVPSTHDGQFQFLREMSNADLDVLGFALHAEGLCQCGFRPTVN